MKTSAAKSQSTGNSSASGQEYGPEAAPESLLAAATRT